MARRSGNRIEPPSTPRAPRIFLFTKRLSGSKLKLALLALGSAWLGGAWTGLLGWARDLTEIRTMDIPFFGKQPALCKAAGYSSRAAAGRSFVRYGPRKLPWIGHHQLCDSHRRHRTSWHREPTRIPPHPSLSSPITRTPPSSGPLAASRITSTRQSCVSKTHQYVSLSPIHCLTRFAFLENKPPCAKPLGTAAGGRQEGLWRVMGRESHHASATANSAIATLGTLPFPGP